MNHSRNDHQSPLARFPGKPTPKLHERGVEAMGDRHCCFPVMPNGKGFMQVDLNKNQALITIGLTLNNAMIKANKEGGLIAECSPSVSLANCGYHQSRG